MNLTITIEARDRTSLSMAVLELLRLFRRPAGNIETAMHGHGWLFRVDDRTLETQLARSVEAKGALKCHTGSR